MQHSYDSLDRPGGFGGLNLLAPLRHRDFRVLWAGMTVSLLGDGIFLVALAWHVYSIHDAPSALSLVGIAMTIPTIVFLLPGGVISDRLDRRAIMLLSDLVRAAAIGAMAALTLAGSGTLWEIAGLSMLYGVGTAFFTPAFEAVIPDLLPSADLPAANSLDQFVRPIALRLAGPAAGGALIGLLGAGAAFAVDAGSFVVSALAVLAIAPTPQRGEADARLVDDIRSGLRFIRGRVWIWGTLVSAAVAYLLFLGPTEVLLPYLVKNDLHDSARTLGLVFAAGGVGAVGSAVVMGQREQPRRHITFIYATWTLATLAVAGYGLATAAWQVMIACLAFNALETAGTIVWATLKQRHVPANMLGRVSSLDWLISIGFLPLSFALTAPVAAAIGTRATLVGAGVAGAVVTLAALFLPGMRDIEHEPEMPAESGVPPAETAAAEPVNVLVETLHPRSATDTRA
jgi:DHA3 family tetracycline resistance protein-like MFS transporter